MSYFVRKRDYSVTKKTGVITYNKITELYRFLLLFLWVLCKLCNLVYEIKFLLLYTRMKIERRFNCSDCNPGKLTHFNTF